MEVDHIDIITLCERRGMAGPDPGLFLAHLHDPGLLNNDVTEDKFA